MHRSTLIVAALFAFLFLISSCKKDKADGPETPADSTAASFAFDNVMLNGKTATFNNFNVPATSTIRMKFQAPVQQSSVAGSLLLSSAGGATPSFTTSFDNGDSTIIIQTTGLTAITRYTLGITTRLLSHAGGALQSAVTFGLITQIDSTAKFPVISDDALLDKVQQQTLKYFYDYGHPVSGMALERFNSGNTVTTGGTGFGIMALIAGASRNFISRADAAARILQIANFLGNNAKRYHGAFPHWMDGATGATIPFSNQDDGADLVETSYLMEGLLCARQYFNNAGSDTALRNRINALWTGVDWQWFRQSGQNVLYWHWSPDFFWAINQPVSGWNEALIVYALAASAPANPVPKIVYDNGWAGNGTIKNNQQYLGVALPLGEPFGGPLFFEHYSFMGINPKGLTDAYADYGAQTVAHSQINYKYCVSNPQSYNGYSDSCWGLTASDDNVSGYAAHSPTNDLGIISPTAAISSLPYTPAESMQALKFFYYALGDKLWGDYGFKDAFNLTDPWFADSYLAIDQGPEIVMIENYRSGLIWNLFMSCPEIKTGMKSLGFQSANLN